MATSATQRRSPRRVAVYWDFENLVISEYDRIHGNRRWKEDSGTAAKPTKAAAAAIHIDALLSYTASMGTVVVNRAYCDWTRPILDVYGAELAARCVEPVQMFSTDTGKNGADIRIALDVVDDARWDDQLTDVVVFSGDGDFAPVADFCRLRGITIHAVGVRRHTNRFWQSSCRFQYLDTLADRPPRPPLPGPDAITLMTDALQLLPAGQELHPAHLVPLMRRLDWAFDPAISGYPDTAALIEAGMLAGVIEATDHKPGAIRRAAPSRPAADASTDQPMPASHELEPATAAQPSVPSARSGRGLSRALGLSLVAVTSAVAVAVRIGTRRVGAR